MFAFALWDAARAGPAPRPRPAGREAALLRARRAGDSPSPPRSTPSFPPCPGSRRSTLRRWPTTWRWVTFPHPKAIWRGVRKLPPGHFLELRRAARRRSRNGTGGRASPRATGARSTSSRSSCGSASRRRFGCAWWRTSRSGPSCPAASIRAVIVALMARRVRPSGRHLHASAFPIPSSTRPSRRAGGRALRHRSPDAGGRDRRLWPPDRAGGAYRRAVRRQLGAADLPRLARSPESG